MMSRANLRPGYHQCGSCGFVYAGSPAEHKKVCIHPASAPESKPRGGGSWKQKSIEDMWKKMLEQEDR